MRVKFCTCFFLHRLLHALLVHGFLVLLAKMSGIENTDGSQHCYYNALLQCLSINETLFSELEHHNLNHIVNEGKVCQ